MISKRTREERGKLVIAMETICRHINDENVFMDWLIGGVADGDITSETTWEDEALESYYEDDEDFANLMNCFLRVVYKAAKKNGGGMYCNGVTSNVGNTLY